MNIPKDPCACGDIQQQTNHGQVKQVAATPQHKDGADILLGQSAASQDVEPKIQ